MKADTIIAVKDVEVSSEWYQSLFSCRSMHGGTKFDILVSEDNEVLLCLHKWGEDNHPTLMNPSLTPDNGLIIYFRTDNMKGVRKKVEAMGIHIEEEVHLNPNSEHQEFSIRDLDGYYITITEYHNYEGK